MKRVLQGIAILLSIIGFSILPITDEAEHIELSRKLLMAACITFIVKDLYDD